MMTKHLSENAWVQREIEHFHKTAITLLKSVSQVKGRLNLWTQGQVKPKYEIDAQTVEELFGQHDGQSKTLATPARGGKTSSSFRETKQEVCFWCRAACAAVCWRHGRWSEVCVTVSTRALTSDWPSLSHTQVSILDAKRGMNIAIFLKQFKR